MALTLHLGVEDQPYDRYEPNKKVSRAKKGKANAPIKSSGGTTQTTYEVAQILENEYHIMGTFVDKKMPLIVTALEDSITRSLEDLLVRGSKSTKNLNPFKSAESKIAQAFKDFISNGEVEHSGIPGTPTGAALRGVNHRLANPYVKSNPRRASFIDTDTYRKSAMCWVE